MLIQRKNNDMQVLDKIDKAKVAKKTIIKKSIVDSNNLKANEFIDELKDSYLLITKENELATLYDCIKQNDGIYALDTETNGLDFDNMVIAGFSIYTDGHKSAYIPINHVDSITRQKAQGQLNINIIKDFFNNLLSSKPIYHNAKFDYKVIKTTLGIDMPIYYDTMVASYLIDENLSSHSLKELYKYYHKIIYGDKAQAMRLDDLFSTTNFTTVPYKLGYIYAAHDTLMTYELYKIQLKIFEKENFKNIKRLYDIIELPLVKAVANMELQGIIFSLDNQKELLKKYEKLLIDSELKLNSTLDFNVIDDYRKKNINKCKLANPINYKSPAQIQVLLDLFNWSKDEKGTGEAILNKINNDFTKALLDYREAVKLLDTYINGLPKAIKKDGRIHCSFNQFGARTGRFSSSEPNLQNIPSRKSEIRSMFIPTRGYKLISCDYSKQELAILACLSQDEALLQAFREGKDVYSFIASIGEELEYEQCLESYSSEAKQIRHNYKQGVLGVMYSEGTTGLAEQLGIDEKKAKKVYDSIYFACPRLKSYTEEVEVIVRSMGYVETFYGRRRRLPSLLLPDYEYTLKDLSYMESFDPFDLSVIEEEGSIPSYKIEQYNSMLKKCYGFKKRQECIKQLESEGVLVKDNTKIKIDDLRKAVNSIIQGTAADMMKYGIVNIFNCKELDELGFRLLLTIHDEIIGECPEENVEKVLPLVEECMLKHTRVFEIPFKVDISIMDFWK